MPNKTKTTKAPVIRTGDPSRVSRARERVHREGASFPVPPPLSETPADYAIVLARLKQRIAAAQTRAVLGVNRELIALYWHVGGTIVHRQTKAGWGDAVVERLAHDLRRAFPDLEGFSPRNIWRMRAFYLSWSGSPEKLTLPVSESSAKSTVKKPPQTADRRLPLCSNDVPLNRDIRPSDTTSPRHRNSGGDGIGLAPAPRLSQAGDVTSVYTRSCHGG